MPKSIVSNPKYVLGVLGGGQLGKMLIQAASCFDIQIKILDPDTACSAKPYAHEYVQGSFKDYDTVMEFGKNCDALTIEIEHVNTKALKDLEKSGVVVHPSPTKLEIIQDKGLQKEFYKAHNIPSSPYILVASEDELKAKIASNEITFPFVQKMRTGGYDGKGVAVLNTAEDLDKLLPGPSVIEEQVAIAKELSVIVSRSKGSDKTVCFDTVEMIFNPIANLVEFLQCPANITAEVNKQCKKIAIKTIEQLDLYGILAVELFLDQNDNVLLNEVAPRPHNSGHHTIDSCTTSQYEQHIRAVLGWPLGSTENTSAAVMLNLLGEPAFEGPVYYQGLDSILNIPGVKCHFYGKQETRPYRKMGHITIIDKDITKATEKAQEVKNTLKVISHA